jgi:hypothetical protein
LRGSDAVRRRPNGAAKAVGVNARGARMRKAVRSGRMTVLRRRGGSGRKILQQQRAAECKIEAPGPALTLFWCSSLAL